MKLALGTLELDEDARKKIGKSIKGSSYLKRDEAKAWALGLIETEIARITNPTPAPNPADTQVVPVGGPPEADSLPYPGPATTPSLI